MCGGVAWKMKQIPKIEMVKYYSPELLARFETEGRVEAFFWDKQAVLPVNTKDGVQLKLWGNKDKELKLPKTGWARSESLAEGKWDYLLPEPVDIPVDSGYEKKTWFDFKTGTKGILVNNNGEERVYMITQEASEEYERETGHDREPVGKKVHYEHVQ
jgi:hypothetical protein